jgi:hypothetical protein
MPEASLWQLQASLDDDSAYVRGCAAQSLGALGFRASRAVPSLARAADQDGDAHVRERARAALEAIEAALAPARD